jgi:hypothetical protein
MASHDPRFESDRACLGHDRPSCTGWCTSCTKLTTVGSSIASEMAAAATAAHPMADWRVETVIQARGVFIRYLSLNYVVT